MNILISGGTGLIGQALGESLKDAGHTVHILTRRAGKNIAAGFIPHEWNGASSTGWGDILPQMDVIFHLAGENIGSGLWTAERKKADYPKPVEFR